MAVIQAGSMGKAAARLHISQPSVTKSIADLERALGVRLLDRSRQGVAPTPHGLALVRRGVVIFDELQHGVQDLEFLSDPTAGELRIATTEPLGIAVVSPVIDRLSRQYPRMSFHVVTGDTAMLYRELEERTVELAMSRLTAPVTEAHSAEILFRDPLVVVTGAKNPLTRRRKIKLSELMNEPWAGLPFDSVFGSTVADMFRLAGLTPPRLTVSCVSINMRNELLASGRFLSVLPSFLHRLPRRHPRLRTLPIELPDTRWPIAIITLKNRQLSPLAQLFCERVHAFTKPLAKEN